MDFPTSNRVRTFLAPADSVFSIILYKLAENVTVFTWGISVSGTSRRKFIVEGNGVYDDDDDDDDDNDDHNDKTVEHRCTSVIWNIDTCEESQFPTPQW
jgi:hypothetical protein